MDPRIRQLAKNLTTYSVALQKNDNVLLDISGHDALPLAEALLEESYARGANPSLHLSEPRLTRAYLTGAAEEQMRQLAEFELTRMKKWMPILPCAPAIILLNWPMLTKSSWPAMPRP